jgi:hypothetical protein
MEILAKNSMLPMVQTDDTYSVHDIIQLKIDIFQAFAS